MLRRVVLVVALLLTGCSLTRKLVYHPVGVVEPSPHLPAQSEYEPETEDLFFKAEDGTQLHGWLARYRGATRAVLFCHGNRGSIFSPYCQDVLLALRKYTRSHVLFWDYRGYGRSEGEPVESDVQKDAVLALRALGETTNVPASRTILVGQSLGGAVATDLAFRVPEVGGLVLLSTFTTVNDITQDLTALPIGFLVPESWRSLEKIGSISCPKLIVHGDKDDVVPFEHGQRLFEAAREPKRFIHLKNADHFLPLYRECETVQAIAALVSESAPER